MENYEKKYKSLVKAVKTLKEANPSDEGIQNWVKDNVPELKESEDDRIRKCICLCLEECVHNDIIRDYEKDKCLTWLEKQCETTDVDPVFSYNNLVTKKQSAKKPIDKVESKFKVGDIISNGTSEVKIVEVNDNSYSVTNDEIENDCNLSNWVIYFKDQDNWKLKDRVQPQSQWKPSDEQIGVIEAVINNTSFQRRHLDSLYADLKKLRGK